MTAHHPQADRLVDRMNQTIKRLLRKTDEVFPNQWDKYLHPLLFALQETPQASIAVAPFELVFRRCPCGLMNVLRDG